MAIQQYGLFFIQADDELKKDKEFVLKSVHHHSWLLQLVNDEFKKDKEVVLKAIQKDISSFQYANDELKKDKEFVLKLQQNGSSLQYVNDELKKDKEVVLNAVQQTGWALQYADDDLKKDKEVVLKAIQEYGWSLEYAKEEMWKYDPEILPPKENRNTNFTNLGDDQKGNILSYLKKQDNLNLSLTCKGISKVTKSNIIWKQYVGERFIKKEKEKLLFNKEIESNYNLEDIEESEGIRGLFLKSQKEVLIKKRKEVLQEIKEKIILGDNTKVHIYKKNYLKWFIFFIFTIISLFISSIVLPIGFDFYPYRCWWVFGYIPLFIIGIIYIPLFWDHLSRLKTLQLPHVIIINDEYQNISSESEFYMYPIHIIPLFLLYLGIILIIPYLRNLGLWRIYFIPLFFYLLYLNYILTKHCLRSVEKNDSLVYTLYSITSFSFIHIYY